MKCVTFCTCKYLPTVALLLYSFVPNVHIHFAPRPFPSYHMCTVHKSPQWIVFIVMYIVCVHSVVCFVHVFAFFPVVSNLLRSAIDSTAAKSVRRGWSSVKDSLAEKWALSESEDEDEYFQRPELPPLTSTHECTCDVNPPLSSCNSCDRHPSGCSCYACSLQIHQMFERRNIFQKFFYWACIVWLVPLS